MSKYFKLLFSLFLGLFFFCSYGKAMEGENLPNTINQDYIIQKLASNPQINSVRSVANGIVQINSSGSIAGYYIGTTDKVSASSTYRVATTNNTYYVGVKNGTYYFWVYGNGLSTGSVAPIMYAGALNVTNSCTNETKVGVTGTGTVERCFVAQNGAIKPDQSGSLITCAAGYTISQSDMKVVTNECNNLSMSYGGQTLTKRYCKVVYSYECKPGTVVSTPARLTSMQVNAGSLSPNFNGETFSYKVAVSSDVGSIKIDATAANGSSFVSNYGPRTVRLNYGTNKVVIKVQNASGEQVSYTILVTRADNRSTVNTLSNLSLSQGDIGGFSAEQTSYFARVDSSVSSLEIRASLYDSKAYFEEGYGPRSVDLAPGLNTFAVRVRSEAGTLRVYTIDIFRETGEENPGTCTADIENVALLKGIDITTDLENISIPSIEFDSKVFTYSIKVPYSVANVIVKGYTLHEGDLVTVVGGANLEEDKEEIITITIRSAECQEIERVYTIGVTRTTEEIKSSNSEVASITVEGHEEFTFQANEPYSGITLKKNEKKLKNIIVNTVDEGTTCEALGNEKLKYGSKIIIKCVSEDETSTSEYVIQVTGVKKGTNVFFIIILVILVILVIVYIVLRLLGYKIYFNFAMIGAFFREMWQKIKNIFDK